MVGIYKITNKLNGKSYIGQSIHCGKRLDEHLKGSQFIDEIIQIEGIENFQFEILKEVERNELNYWEDYYIIEYNTLFPNGYNKKMNNPKHIQKEIKGKNKKIRVIANDGMEKHYSQITDKQWSVYFALPENDETFKAMSDILYTYLYSISKHNPKKKNGVYLEKYNYIYVDGRNGSFTHKDIYTELNMSRATYYRKLDTLEKLGLLYRTEYYGRKIIQIPFINSKKILNVDTCKFLSTISNNLGWVPDDVIKILCLLKIYYYSKDKTFTISLIKANLGYSTKNNDKNSYVYALLNILRGLDLIDFYGEVKEVGTVERVIYTITKADDSFNNRLQLYTKDTNIEEIIDKNKIYEFE